MSELNEIQDTILNRTAAVMVLAISTRDAALTERVKFREADWLEREEDHGSYRELVLDLADWEAMGKPEEITVTVEPGDTLNG